jgi:hypothetical protein
MRRVSLKLRRQIGGGFSDALQFGIIGRVYPLPADAVWPGEMGDMVERQFTATFQT